MKHQLLILFLTTLLLNSCGVTEKNKPPSFLQRAEYFENSDKIDSAIVYYTMLSDSLQKSHDDSLVLLYNLRIIDLMRKKGDFSSCQKEISKTKYSELEGLPAVKVLLIKGNVQYDLGNYNEAEMLFSEANKKTNVSFSGNKQLLAECLNNLGKTYLVLNNFDRTDSLLKQALQINKLIFTERSPQAVETNIILGAYYSAKGDYEKALSLFDEQLKYLSQKSLLKAALLNYTGIAYYRLSEYNSAHDEFKKSLEIRLEFLDNNHPLVADVYNNLGLLYDFFGEPVLAIDYYTKALNIRIKNFGEKKRVIARNYNNLANACKDKREYERSLQYYKSAIEILTAISPDDLDIGVVLINYGETNALLKNYPEAVRSLYKAIEIQKKYLGDKHPWIAITYLNLGTAFSDYNKQNEAKFYLNKSLAMAKEVFKGNHHIFSQIYNEFGRIEAHKKNYKASLGYYQQSLINLIPSFHSKDIYSNPYSSDLNNDNLILETLILKARSLMALTGTKSELPSQTYDLIGEMIDKIRSGFKDESSRLLLSENIKEVMDDAINCYFSFYNQSKNKVYAQKAYEFCERSKALLLLETILDKKARKFGGIPDSLLDKETRIKSRLSVLDKKLHDEIENSSGDSLKYKQLQNSLIELKHQHLALITYFEKNYPDYYKLKYNTRTVDLKLLFRKLTSSSMMIEYFLSKECIYVFTYHKGKLDFISVPVRKDVNELCNNFLKGLRELNYPLYASSAYELYTILMEPLKTITSGKNIIFIPDGILNYIPFEALISVKPDLNTMDYKKLHYLVYDYKMSYGYSAALLYENIYREGNLTDGSFIGFAPY